MITLKYIKDEIQKIAEAIEAVLEIDVTIVDDKLIRIAGTGRYIDKIGEKLDGYSAFKKSSAHFGPSIGKSFIMI